MMVGEATAGPEAGQPASSWWVLARPEASDRMVGESVPVAEAATLAAVSIRTGTDLSKYRRALNNLAYRYRGITDFEETIVIRYLIGQRSDEDYAQCESITRAANPTQSVLWRTVAFGATGGQTYTFDGVGFQIEAEEEASIDFLPIREAGPSA
jgi:hypothetical protein